MPLPPGPPPSYARQSLEDWIGGEEFSCLGARASVRRGTLEHGQFGPLDDPGVARELYERLVRFIDGSLSEAENFATYVAVFSGPEDVDEERFELLLWRMLSDLHELDRPRHDWDPEVSNDPASPHFSFSLAATAFFVVGMHARSSRISRRFPLPAMAFNGYGQFQRLRRNGTYQGMQQRIRQRELRLQGSLNPNLSDHGVASDARQYSGRRVGPEWNCPFRSPEPTSHPHRSTEETM